MKRDIKKKLKEDEFVSGMNKFMHFVRTWEREILIAAAAAAAVLLLFLGFQFLKAQQVKKESRTAGQILELRSGLAAKPENAAQLEKLGGKGKFSRVSYISLATYWVEQGQLDKAQAALAKIKDETKDFFYYQALDLSAQIAILKGEYDKAIDLLKKIEADKPKDYLLDAILFRRAEALEKKGDMAEALKLYKTLQADYAQSYFGYDASLKVKKLEAAK
ncbi:MAG: tetratricopeptide repeat protein [Candidatus Aminicenantes bacterium]|jgi:predicted negative regulator of RcsB-dependent stress response|nr:tetratricopeptide repeat protein [Candidatus Aminicenantes bacterium]